MPCAVKNELNCRNTTPLSWTGDNNTRTITLKDIRIVVQIRLIRMIDLKNEITLYSKPSCLFGRPYSRCPPSLQALKD